MGGEENRLPHSMPRGLGDGPSSPLLPSSEPFLKETWLSELLIAKSGFLSSSGETEAAQLLRVHLHPPGLCCCLCSSVSTLVLIFVRLGDKVLSQSGESFIHFFPFS